MGLTLKPVVPALLSSFALAFGPMGLAPYADLGLDEDAAPAAVLAVASRLSPLLSSSSSSRPSLSASVFQLINAPSSLTIDPSIPNRVTL